MLAAFDGRDEGDEGEEGDDADDDEDNAFDEEVDVELKNNASHISCVTCLFLRCDGLHPGAQLHRRLAYPFCLMKGRLSVVREATLSKPAASICHDLVK